MKTWGRAAELAAMTATAVAISATGASAATINVDLTADNVANDEQCTLREAVTTANSNLPVNGATAVDADCEVGQSFTTDVIVLGSATYTLAIAGSGNDNNQTGDLDLQAGGQGDVQIDGTGSATTEIDGADLDRVIDVVSGNTTVTLSDLHVDNGTGPTGEPGGAIRNTSGNNLTLNNVSVTNSTSDASGGGIHFSNSLGTLSLTNSTVSGNAVTFATGLGSFGAGIRMGTGTLSLSGSTISGNIVNKTGTGGGGAVDGGGIVAQNGTMNIDDSTISGNQIVLAAANTLDFPGGAGIAQTNVTTTITDSTISGNSIPANGNSRAGAGIDHTDQDATPNNPLTITNSTFSGNSVGSGSSHGAAINLSQGITRLANVTITNNTAATGRAIYYQQQGNANSSITVRGSIFEEDNANECASPTGDLTSAGYNIDRNMTCGLASGTDQQNTDPSLGSLFPNGGPTQTHVLNAGSAGIDEIPANQCFDTTGSTLLTADQRGVARPQGTDCDIGAYERGPECGTLASTIVGTGSGETINGTSGSDVIAAGGGGDSVNAGGGADRVCGGDGDDTIRTGTGADADVAFGGDDSTDTGTDTISFSDLSAGLTAATLSTSVNSTSGTDSGIDSLSGFENLTGSPFNDQSGSTGLTGNAGQNTIDGGAGDDIIQGLADNDTLIGGAGSEDTATWISLGPVAADLAAGTATGVQGNDTLSGFENLTGSSGTDTLTGDSAQNDLNGFSDNDVLDGRGQNDFLTGGPGGDTASFSGLPGPVTATLSLGALTATGQGTDGGNTLENLTGSPDSDTLTGDGLANVISGSGGNDTLADGVTTTANPDSFIGGGGTDAVSYAARTSGSANVTVDLTGTVDNAGQAGENDDVGADIENATGGAGQDSLIGDESANALMGGDNGDVLNGREAADVLAGDAGFDAARYLDLPGPVTVNLNSGIASGAQGGDSLSLVENLVGSPDGDTLTGNGTGNALFGGAGNDTLDGRESQDILDGGGDSDTASFAGLPSGVQATLTAGALSAGGGQGNDSGTSIENLTGSDAADTLTGDDNANVLTGGLGADIVFALAGPDTLLIRDGVGDTADCGTDADTDNVEADTQGTDTLTSCGSPDVIAFPAQPQPPVTQPQPQPTGENPLCAALRKKLKKAKRAGNRPLVRKLRGKLKRLGC
jgi:CSLREA domain-containing protein